MRFGEVIAAKLQRESARVERARAEFNFRSIQAQVPQGCKVLDVGAWSCYLGQLLRDRMGCEALSLDVVDANKTDMPFQVFDGKALPVDSRSFDVVLFSHGKLNIGQGWQAKAPAPPRCEKTGISQGIILVHLFIDTVTYLATTTGSRWWLRSEPRASARGSAIRYRTSETAYLAIPDDCRKRGGGEFRGYESLAAQFYNEVRELWRKEDEERRKGR